MKFLKTYSISYSSGLATEQDWIRLHKYLGNYPYSIASVFSTQGNLSEPDVWLYSH